MKLQILKDKDVMQIMENLNHLFGETVTMIESNDKDVINAHNARINNQCNRLYQALKITF